jgi:pimeloyl-ACP methyl ester carboxylesterase
LLHGGACPKSVQGFAEKLAAHGDLQVLVPVHPGFDATARPTELTTVGGLARLYVALLAELGLTGVTVAGNSLGGWIAAEIALLGDPLVERVVLLDAGGLHLPEAPTADIFSLTLDEVMELSFANPEPFLIDPASLPPQAQALMAANMETLHVYGGPTMADPNLLGRLSAIAVPTLVVWGKADRAVPTQHGEAFADAIPQARLELIDDAGHLPQLESPDRLQDLLLDFLRP